MSKVVAYGSRQQVAKEAQLRLMEGLPRGAPQGIRGAIPHLLPIQTARVCQIVRKTPVVVVDVGASGCTLYGALG